MLKYFIPCTLNILSVNLLSLDLPSEIFMSFVGSELIFCSKLGSKYGQNPFSSRKKDPRGRTLEGLKILYLCGLSTILQLFLNLQFYHLHDIRPVYCSVQMAIFRVICGGKSGFSTVSV